jgi:hypothetical protein
MAVLLGRTSGGTTGDFINSTDAIALQFTASASGNVATLWFQSKVANASPATTSVELGIYTNSAGVPVTLLGSATNTTAAEIQATTPFKVTLATPVAVVASTSYWLAVRTVGSGGWDFQGDPATAWSIQTGTSGLPATWAQTSTASSSGVLIWGEDAAAAPSPLRRSPFGL